MVAENIQIERDTFEIEKLVYNTQWTNIRHHWDQTVAGVRYLSSLIPLAIPVSSSKCNPVVKSNKIYGCTLLCISLSLVFPNEQVL